MIQQRKIWVDWAKVLGMYTIIYGHCFPETMSNFIYAFNVPVFFIISGYLCKKEQDFSTCWNKTLHNLIIPYYILAFIKVAGAIFKHLDDGQCKFVRVISSGTIVILVFHRELLHPMLKWISQQNFDAITSDALMALSAVIVLAAFYPLILIVKRVFPIVLGRRMKS
mgnify:CR=1 FL=1